MPEIGEIKSGKELGYSRSTPHIWLACLDCGKGRWVALHKGKPVSKKCRACSAKSPERIQQVRLKLKGRTDMKMENHPCWKGGRSKDTKGYIRIRLSPDNPFYSMVNSTGCVMEHRLVMAESLGRCLGPYELIHHKNGVRDDNRIENLELTYGVSEHILNHSKGYRYGYAEGLKDGRLKQIQELKMEIAKLKGKKNGIK